MGATNKWLESFVGKQVAVVLKEKEEDEMPDGTLAVHRIFLTLYFLGYDDTTFYLGKNKSDCSYIVSRNEYLYVTTDVDSLEGPSPDDFETQGGVC